MRKNFAIFVCGICFAPVAIILHEYGHFATALVFGIKPHLHFARTTTAPTTPVRDFIVTAAGPTVTALMALGGLLSLWSQRRRKYGSPTAWSIWLATFFTLSIGRWLLRPPSQQGDEVKLSTSLGLPPLFLPWLFAAVALGILVMTIRLHEPGNRMIPFSSAILGLYLGCLVWVRVLGPRILPYAPTKSLQPTPRTALGSSRSCELFCIAVPAWLS